MTGRPQTFGDRARAESHARLMAGINLQTWSVIYEPAIEDPGERFLVMTDDEACAYLEERPRLLARRPNVPSGGIIYTTPAPED